MSAAAAAAGVACPVCGAAGVDPCKGAGGKPRTNHDDRDTAKRAAKRAAAGPRSWDASAVGRAIRVEGRRVAGKGTEVDLAELAALRSELESAITDAVVGLNAREATWAAIGEAFGVSRSAAFQRYSKAVEAARSAV